MLVITIELWPHGDRSRKRKLGEARIANITDAKTVGHDYSVRMEGETTGDVWNGFVRRFDRGLGAWALLGKAIENMLQGRKIVGRFKA
jgi:hypothetical protein